jgi:uncharacterized protein YndB with AHSA1/START domain
MMSTLRVEAQGSAAASPEAVWALVSNAASYAEWGAWDGSGDRELGGKASGDAGTTRWMRYHNTTTVEQVLEADSGRRLAYTVVSGIPVRNYRAEVTLTPTERGTDIRWTAEWDQTLMGRIVHRTLRSFYPQMMAHLVAAAEQSAATQVKADVDDVAAKEPVTAGR